MSSTYLKWNKGLGTLQRPLPSNGCRLGHPAYTYTYNKSVSLVPRTHGTSKRHHHNPSTHVRGCSIP